MSPAGHAELDLLRRQLAEAEDALVAIRTGEIDAIVVQSDTGPVVYTLKTADTPYRLLVEQMREGALTVSAEGIIIYANAAFARMLNLPAARLRGADLMDFIVDATDRHPSRLFVSLGSSGQDIRLRTSRGEVRNVYMSSAPLAERLYGYTPEEVIGRKVDMLFPGTPGFELSSPRLLPARQAQLETVQVSKSGKQIDVAISVAMIDDGDVPQGISLIARDISERNRTQDHIKVLLRESSHRSKNLLAVIQAIATQTARAADTVWTYPVSVDS
jgi:PAS domain S-box-containing protein